MAGLLDNAVISGLLAGGGANAIRAREQQRVAAMMPRGGGGVMGAPGGAVSSRGGMADLGQGLAGLGQGLAAFGEARKAAAQKEAFEKTIASLPPEQQALARLDPKAYSSAASKAAFEKPDPLTTSNTALFAVPGEDGAMLPKRMRLEEGIKQGLPEWQDPPDMKTFGNDTVGYYGVKRRPDGSYETVNLVGGLGRTPTAPQTVTTAEGVFTLKPDGSLGNRLGSPNAAPRSAKTITTADGVFVLNDDGTLGNRLGGAEFSPQDALAQEKLTQMGEDRRNQAINKYEDLSKTIRQAETVLNHPGREAGTGMSSWQSMVPGSDARGFAAQLETLKSQVFLPEVQKMQGMGALSNAEGQKISAAFASLDPDMPEEEFKQSLSTAIADLKRAQERAQAGLPADYNTSPSSDGSGDNPTFNITVTPQRKDELSKKYGF